MLTTLTEATQYLHDKILSLGKEDISKDVLETLIEDLVYEKIEDKLTEKDIQIIRDNAENEDFDENYMFTKVPGYQTILEEVVGIILAEYIATPEGDLDEDDEEDSLA